MDPTKDRKSSSSSLPLWSRASTRLGIRRKSSSRPVISEPIGPVKNSRGPDFSRSDTLIVVDGIKDCAYSNLPTLDIETGSSHHVETSANQANSTTRRVSASFPQASSTASPTVAKSNVTSAAGIHAPLRNDSRDQLRKASLAAAPRQALHKLKTSSTQSLFPHSPPTQLHDENTPPGLDNQKHDGKPKKQRVSSRLPTSRTMNVLQELKATVSRPSMKSATSLVSNMSDPLASSVSTPQTAPPAPLSKPPTPWSSQASSLSLSCGSPSPDPDPRLIHEAQPSAYWSGRFMSLQDKYSSRHLAQYPPYRSVPPLEKPVSDQSLPSSARRNTTGVIRSTHLPHATTTSALNDIRHMTKPPPPPPPARDEDAQSRQIFKRLEALCVTDEAKVSLYEWQQAYARRHNRPKLLPVGGTMNEKGFVSKWFGSHGQKSHGQKSGRRTLSAWKDGGAYQRLGKTSSASKPNDFYNFRTTMV